MNNNQEAIMLPGARYRATHQASVDAILGPMGIRRKVNSFGEDFVNVDNWYIRILTSNFCKWYRSEKNQVKFIDNIVAANLMKESNLSKVTTPYINIAETPDQLPLRVATALIGAAYHEAWHTKYSHRNMVTADFIQRTFSPRVNFANWGDLEQKLLQWMNLVEDVRIERLGCQDFIGAHGRMVDLQDFILVKEAEVFKDQPADIGAVLFGLFRDLGKAYDSDELNRALDFYKKASPTAYYLVTEGPLKKHFDQTIAMTAADSTMCLPLAMDILITLNDLANDKSKCEQLAKNKKDEAKSQIPDITADDISTGAKEAIKATSGSNMLIEISKALKDAFEELLDNQKISRNGPDIFRPLSTTMDQIVNVRPTGSLDVLRYHAEVRAETNYLRSRLRHLFRASELVDIEHGLRKGQHVSNRMIAESVAMTRLYARPERPFYDVAEAPDLSMSAVVVVDESSSMTQHLANTCKILLCLAESLDSVGCKTAISGFMQSNSLEIHRMAESVQHNWMRDDVHHRNFPMTYHLFKSFNERFHNIKTRLGSLTAQNGTPMADGINFAVNLLSPRNEGHRFIFVITDGQPDDHGPVRNRLQVATTAGIKTIGVGLGDDARYVTGCFPDSVWAESLAEIPVLLVKKITSIVERNELRRGRRISKDNEVL